MSNFSSNFSLALTIARRELRGGLAGFRIFLACLALGVGAIAAVGTVSESIVAGLRADAKRLLGGDVDLRLVQRPATDDQRAWLADNARALSTVAEMRAMARTPGDPRPGHPGQALVELKAVDGAYPLVGALATDPPLAVPDALARDADGAWGAVADPGLMKRLGLAVGDTLSLGEATVRVRATVVKEPDRVASMVSFGPRLMVAAAALPETDLVRPGSQVRYHYRVLVGPAEGGAAWMKRVEATFPKAGWRVRGVDDAAPGVRRFVERMTLFLTFVGLTALLVGGMGVGNAVRSYLDGKTTTIATLKCLGAPTDLVFRAYLLQVLGLGLVGILIGLATGAALPSAVLAAIGDTLPVAPVTGFYPWPLFTAALFGVVTAVTFALWPLGQAREVPAAGLFRHLTAPPRARPGRDVWLGMAAGIAVLAALTFITATDRYFAAWFVGGTAATLLVLRLGAWALMALAKRLPRPRRAEARLALTALHRPGAATAGVVLSLGTGLAVLVAVALIEGNLNAQVEETLPDKAPAFFFIDIQPDQVAAFDTAVTDVPGTEDLQRVPSLRGRIVKIDGVPVAERTISPDAEWAVRGDRALTYAAQPARGSRIVAGEWWPSDYKGPPLISFDANLARGFGVGVGDTLTLNILGREFTATIASLREINWRSLRFDFAIIFAPGTLEGAPHSHVAAVKAPPAAEDAVEKAVTDRFANVSSIRVRDALAAAATIISGIGAAVRGTSLLTIAAGALVLAGTIAAGYRRRIYDAVVFKVLGATRGVVMGAFLLEYGVLGLVTGLIAALVGSVTAWAVVRFLMRMDWVFLPGTVAGTVAVCVLVTVAVGFFGTWRALGRKAAPLLRNE
ncbi:MAG: FtsX-like permease family protein [Rhodobacterales bacterium]|nr:FtsX-like permease family protein [Rhodobacterales bacterium]